MNLQIDAPVRSLNLFRNNSGRIDAASFALSGNQFLKITAKTVPLNGDDELYFLEARTAEKDFEGLPEVHLSEAFSSWPYEVSAIYNDRKDQMALVGLIVVFEQRPPIIVACGSLAHSISLYGIDTKAVDREFEYDSIDCRLEIIAKFDAN